MFLEKIKFIHFRKFNEIGNTIFFFNKAVQNSINIANISTLVVGQNNAGKSTIFKALDILSGNGSFLSTDYNLDYLKNYINTLLSKSEDNYQEITCPFIKFEFDIDVSDDENEDITQAIKVLNISALTGEIKKGKLIIEIRLKDENAFKSFMKAKIDLYEKEVSSNNKQFESKKITIDEVCKKIDEIGMLPCFYNEQTKIDFKFSDLINFKLIDALSVNDECVLSKQFKSILKYHFSNGDLEVSNEMSENIKDINNKINLILKENPTKFINNIIESIITKKRIKMSLQSSVTFDKILDNNVNYFYNEDEYSIPENHYGLGYTKLISIVANLLEYIEKKPNKDFDNKISIIAIEEPETFMHPQLQKCFINNINEVLNKILIGNEKKIKCQLIISTHSPHIVSNKIEESVSINNINYLSLIQNKTQIVLLNDDIFKMKNENIFINIKKHMSFSFAEAMFSDALILVEGFAEEKMIPYFLSNYGNLKNRYISIINIHGAYAFIFEKLISALKIPSVILTDVDFKTKETNQIGDYEQQETTNSTILNYIPNKNISNLESNKIDVNKCTNLKVFIQKKENGYCGTSFEEALILANYNKEILITTLKKVCRNNFLKITNLRDKNIDLEQLYENIRKNSRKIYGFLTNKKGDFTSILLENLFESNETLITPSYILDAFNYLFSELEGSNDATI